MKHWIIVLVCFAFGYISEAQQVEMDGKVYEVKNEKIFLEGKDVTQALHMEERTSIFKRAEIIKLELAQAKETERLEKEKEKALLAQKKAEKEAKKAQKALKKAEKAARQKEKLQKKLEKAKNDLAKAQNKYERLKGKGKLSPNDEEDWLKKIEKLSAKVEKANRKL